MTLAIVNRAGLNAQALADLSTMLGEPTTLDALLSWAAGRRPPLRLQRIVTQDEYTHDVVIPVARDRFLVYDVS